MTDPRAAVRAAAADLLQALAGQRPEPLRVTDADGGIACLIQVWAADQMMPTARPRRDSSRRAGCRRDILDLVRSAGKPLTRKQVVRGLKDAGKAHGLGTVAKALAELTTGKQLENPKDKKGYRLPDWPRRPNTPSLFI